MISAQTPDGAKALILRGVKSPRGLKGIAQGTVTTPDGDKQFWDGSLAALTVTASPSHVTGGISSSSFGTAPVDTSSLTASALGGAAPYSYAWAHISDDGAGGAWSALSPAAATTAFRAPAVPAGGSSSAIFRCTATDARGSAGTVDVSAFVLNYTWFS